MLLDLNFSKKFLEKSFDTVLRCRDERLTLFRNDIEQQMSEFRFNF